MAEKIILFEAAVDNTAANAQMDALSTKLGALKQKSLDLAQVQKDLKKAYADAAKEAAAGNAQAQVKATELAREMAKVTAEQKALQTQTRETNKEMANTQNAKGSINALAAEVAKLSAEYKKMSQSERESASGQAFLSGLQKKQSAVLALEQSIGQSQRQVGNYGVVLQQLAQQSGFGGLANLMQTFTGLEQTIGSLATSTVGVGAAAVQTEGAVAAASGGMLANLGGVGAAAGAAGGAMIGVGIAGAAAFGIAAKNSLTYRDVLLEAQKITGQTTAQLDALARASAEIALPNGRKIISDLSEIGKLQQVILSADTSTIGDAAKLKAETTAAVILSQADPLLSTNEAAKALTTTLKIFNIDGKQSAEVANLLGAGAVFSDQSISQSIDGLLKAAPQAKGVNATLAETVAIIQSAATKAGGAAEAGTQLRNVYSKLSGESIIPPDGLAALKAAGVDTKKLTDTTIPLQERLKELGKIQGDNAAIAKAFEVTNAPVVNTLIQMGNAAEGSASSLTGVLKQIENTNTAFDQAAINQQKAGAAWENLTNRVNNALTNLQFAEILNAAAVAGVNILNGLLDYLGGFFGAISNAISGIATDLAPLFKVFTEIATEIGKVFSSITGGTSLMETFGKVVGTVVTLPLQGLTFIIHTLKAAFELLSSSTTSAFNTLQNGSPLFQKFTAAVKTAWDYIMKFHHAVVDAVGSVGMFFGVLGTNDAKPTSLTAGLRGLQTQFTATTTAAGANANAILKATVAAKKGGDELKSLKADLQATELAFGNLSAADKQGAIGKQLDAQAKQLRAQIAQIENIGKEPKAAKTAKDKAADPVLGSLDAAQKAVADLEKTLQNTEFGSVQFQKLSERLKVQKAQLAELEKQYKDIFITPKERNLAQAQEVKTAKEASIKNDGATDPTGDAAKVEKLRLLEAEREYQASLIAIQDEGSKEEQKAQLDLQAANAAIAKETNALIVSDAKATNEALKKIDDARIADEKLASENSQTEQKSALDVQLANETITELQHKQGLLQIELQYYNDVANIIGLGEKEKAEARKKGGETEQKILLDRLANEKKEQRAAAKQIADTAKQVGQEVVGIAKDFVTAETNEKLSKLDAQKEAELSAAGDNAEKKAAIEKKFAAEKAQIDKEQAEKQKQISIVQAAINGALAITSILAQYPKFDGGIAMAIALAAAVATTIAQISIISSAKFGKGGIVEGASHSSGGVPMRVGATGQMVELEGKEGVVTKAAMQDAHTAAIVSAMNVSGGGVPMTSRTLPNYLSGAINHYRSGKDDAAYKAYINRYRVPMPSAALLGSYGNNSGTVERLLQQNNSLLQINNELTSRVAMNTQRANGNYKSMF